jgi:tetratricopeptide (TPR) repeat protein
LEIQLRLSLVLFAQGVLYFRQGRFDRAAARFRRVLALSPVRHPMAALWLAAALARQGGDASRKGGDASRQGDDPATALAPFLWWWEDGIWPAPLVQLWSGRIGPAAAIVAVMKQIGPVRAQGAFFIGQWYLAHGDRMTAEQWLDRARDLASPKMMELIALKPAASN